MSLDFDRWDAPGWDDITREDPTWARRRKRWLDAQTDYRAEYEIARAQWEARQAQQLQQDGGVP